MRTSTVPLTAINRCPSRVLKSEHYRDDDSCLCDRYDAWTDEDLTALIDARVADVGRRRTLLADALTALARAATSDVESVVLVPPEALTLSSLAAMDFVRRIRGDLNDARDRLAAAATERNRREGTIP